MNYQIKESGVSAETAAKLLIEPGAPTELTGRYLDYYAWPQVFGTTAGPFGGIGGATMTTFTIEAFYDPARGKAVLFCGKKVLRVVNDFKPLMRV